MTDANRHTPYGGISMSRGRQISFSTHSCTVTIHAHCGELRVIAAWQVVHDHLPMIADIRYRIDRKHDLEEMKIIFYGLPYDEPEALVARMIDLPWVTDASFC